MSSLKYFCENAPEYHIVCAGSLLGIALHEGTSFPVGKVEFLKLSPLSFREFLMTMWLSDCGLIHKVSRVNQAGVPLKAYEDLKAKSLKTYRDRFSPEISVRTSMSDYKQEEGLLNLPLYAIEEFKRVLP